jgi:hypothetical protein
MWKQTVFITGLPRSGKSTLFSMIASCNPVQALDEPFDITILCGKSAEFVTESEPYLSLEDTYLTLLEHAFTESVMGRNYNFRSIDKSFIYNYKNKNAVDKAHSIQRRLDYIKATSSKNQTFVLALNDTHDSLEFISRKVPNPKLVFIEKDLLECAYEIEQKGWLSDNNLSGFSDLTPAFRESRIRESKKIHIPYIIPPDYINLFLDLDLRQRSIIYSGFQLERYLNSLKQFKGEVVRISSNSIFSSPSSVLWSLCETLELEITDLTIRNLNAIEERKSVQRYDQLGSLNEEVEKLLYSWGVNL